MAVPTVEAVYTSHSNDGGNAGKAVTTDTTPTTGDYLLYCMAVNANADTLTKPSEDWQEANVSDNSIATAGGQIRAWYLKDPADSTTYTWTVSTSTRRTCIALLIRGADGTTFVDVKESNQSGPGANHTPPALTTNFDDELVVDFAALRQFSPDTANWTVPASGLTWTEQADLQGSDSNNNVRLAAGTASKTSAGAIGTAVWTNSDTFEDSIIIRIAVKAASAGGAPAMPATPVRPRRTWPRQVRGELFGVVRAQLNPPYPTATVDQPRRIRGMRLFRTRMYPVPLVGAAPPAAPTLPLPPERPRLRLPVLPRPRRQPVPAAAVCPAPTVRPRRTPTIVRRTDQFAPPGVQLSPVPVRARRQPPPRPRRGEIQLVPLPQIVLIPPALVLAAKRRRHTPPVQRRGRQWTYALVGLAPHDCTVVRPNTGTVARPDTGTVTRPDTGIVEFTC